MILHVIWPLAYLRTGRRGALFAMHVSLALANYGARPTIPAYCCNQMAGSAAKTVPNYPCLTIAARSTASWSRRGPLPPPGMQPHSSQHDTGSSTSNCRRRRRWRRSDISRTVCGSTTRDTDGQLTPGVRRVRQVSSSSPSNKATSPANGNTKARDGSLDANKQSADPAPGGGGGGGDRRMRLPLGRSVEDAHRMFALGKRLHLRRHRSRVARDTALRLFRESMRLRPDWRETDARFAVDSGIDNVFQAFSCGNGDRATTRSNRNTTINITNNSNQNIAEIKGNGGGVDGYDSRRRRSSSGSSDEQTRGDITVTADVACLRATLAGVGYTACRVQERFGRAAGPAGGQRLPGPYYLRKSLDHTNASMVASLGPPRDGLDVAIRLFLLGLALPRKDVECSLGSEAVDSLSSLGMLGECPVDPSLLVSLVQLFPLDAEALSAPSDNPVDDGDYRETIAVSGALRGHRGGDEEEEEEETEEGSETVVLGKRVDGAQSPAIAAVAATAAPADATAAAATGGTIARASDLVFATDWPPPGSSALTEEPVMYIGPDSIGLVQHAPRSMSPSKMPPPRSAEKKREPCRCQHQGDPRGAETAVHGNEEEERETILDLCCGSGVQGIAAAALRRGRARVTCVDINPRAVRFARFNALLNGLGDDASFNAVVGDLYCAALERGGSGGGSPDYDGALVSRTVSQRDGETHQDVAAVEEDSGDALDKTTTTQASNDGGGNELLFDLILANPPFVPVPPRLDSVRRRYDLFASGGASGEEVIEGLFRGAFDRLRPSGGVLAVVSELANPRTFDAKLRSWVGAHDDRLTAAATESTVGTPRVAEGGEVGGESNHQNEQKTTPDTTTSNAPTVNQPQGFDDSRRFSLEGVGEAEKACVAWTGLVLHEKEPWTAREYAARRAGSVQEAEGWVRHFERMGIEEMANGFVFVRRAPRAAAAAADAADAAADAGGDGGVDMEGRKSLTRTRAAVEIQGVEKLWAPHNRAAVDRTNASLSRM